MVQELSLNMEIEREYHDNQQLKYELSNLNGVRHGIQRWWFKNGIQSAEYFMKNDQDHGMCQFWNIDQTLKSIDQSKFHNRHGPNIEFKYK